MQKTVVRRRGSRSGVAAHGQTPKQKGHSHVFRLDADDLEHEFNTRETSLARGYAALGTTAFHCIGEDSNPGSPRSPHGTSAKARAASWAEIAKEASQPSPRQRKDVGRLRIPAAFSVPAAERPETSRGGKGVSAMELDLDRSELGQGRSHSQRQRRCQGRGVDEGKRGEGRGKDGQDTSFSWREEKSAWSSRPARVEKAGSFLPQLPTNSANQIEWSMTMAAPRRRMIP